MKIALQTMDHGLQYKYARALFNEKLGADNEIRNYAFTKKVVENSAFIKLLFYYKRRKIIPLIKNIVSRLVFKNAINKYKNKQNIIDRLIEDELRTFSDPEYKNVTNQSDMRKCLEKFNPDVVVVIGSPYLTKDYFLDGVIYINLHIGIIPEYRGLKCIEWAILKDDYSGIGYTIHEMTTSLDFGKIYHREIVQSDGRSLSQIYFQCYLLGIQKMVELCQRKIFDGIFPVGPGSVFYTIDFNGYAVHKLLKKVSI